MRKPPRSFVTLACCAISVLFFGSNSLPQSQALDAQLEGFVYDQNYAVLPGATVIATNTSTGFVRTMVTDQIGFYRMPLMPLGTYRLTVEARNHMQSVREVTLVVGQTATNNFTLSPGEVVEAVSVIAGASIVDAGKTEIGVVLGNRETSNLPLISRNPLNLVFQQPNVSGRPNRGFLQFPVTGANGFRSRVHYQVDGSTATHIGRAGVRLMVVPETFVKEIQLVSSGFAPEFGNTPGVIMNMITPSGTNEIAGSATYVFRRPSFYSRPFNYSSAEKLPDSRVDGISIKLGLPLVKDRWHLFSGYEQQVKDDKGIPNRLLTITEDEQAALIGKAGLPAEIFPPAIPTLERGRFVIFRSDLQLNEKHRLAVRFNHADIFVENNIAGGRNTLERSVDIGNADHAIAAQLVSYSTSFVNELRFQRAIRRSIAQRNEFSGTGPSVVITNVANFGSPEDADSPPNIERAVQMQNNLTFVKGAHVAKFGGGLASFRNTNFAAVFARFTFQNLSAYLAARSGVDPRAYSRYVESSGDTRSHIESTFWNLFAQDDWRLTPRLKLTFGVRYDLYGLPDADPNAPLPISRKFVADKSNFAPRFAAVFAIRQGERPTVIRAGAGIYFEQPWLDMYERALRQNGDPKFFNFNIRSDSPEAPAFPTTFPPGLQLAPPNIDAVAHNMDRLYAIHANVQFEQAITNTASIAVGYIRTGGRHIPVYRSINYVSVGHLGDGRPVFGSARLDPRFNNIQVAEAVGVSKYDAVFFQFAARSWNGVSVNAHYTLSKATDDAPEQNVTFPNSTSIFQSNPYDRSFDRGRSFADQRHTFVTNVVAQPRFEIGQRFLRTLLNDNQLAIIATANSGYAFNIVSTRDLNQDGLWHDRPLGVARNSGTTPALFNLDLRYSRFVPFAERFRLEVFAEFTNLLNINSIVQFNNTEVVTDTNGLPIGGIPDFRTYNQSVAQESRQTQIGLKFHF